MATEYTIKLNVEQLVFLQRCLDKVDLEVFGKEIYIINRRIADSKIDESSRKEYFRLRNYWVKQQDRIEEINKILNTADWKVVEIEETVEK